MLRSASILAVGIGIGLCVSQLTSRRPSTTSTTTSNRSAGPTSASTQPAPTSKTSSNTSSKTSSNTSSSTSPPPHSVGVIQLDVPLSAEQRSVNLSLLNLAVPLVSTRLIVCLRQSESALAASVRTALLSVYDDVFEVGLEVGRPTLDCVVLPPPSHASGLVGVDDVLLLPEVDVYLGDGSADGFRTAGAASEHRRSKGMSLVAHVSLEPGLSKLRLSDALLFNGTRLKPTQVYRNVVCGGTFDHLHAGHKKLLTVVAMLATRTAVVGVTDESMNKKKKGATNILPFHVRARAVEAFLLFLKPTITVKIARLLEPFGPTITDPDIQAIVVSSETVRGAFKINETRTARGMPVMDVVSLQREHAQLVSSTYLRTKL